MISVLADDDRSGFGVRTVLDLERIPYRRIARAEDAAGLLVAAGAAAARVPATVARRVPTVLVGGGASGLVRDLLAAHTVDERAGAPEIALDGPLWSPRVRARAAAAGAASLRLPLAPVAVAAPLPGVEVLARWRGADGAVEPPALVRAGQVWWWLVDVGAGFAGLLDESYRRAAATGALARAVERAGTRLYYRLPGPLRRAVQRRAYRRLAPGAEAPGASAYPVDTGGWLAIEALVATLRAAAPGGLVRLARWPAPYTAAAALTHDLEPTAFAYGPGLDALARRVRRRGAVRTFGVVARRLTPAAAARLAGQDVLCHGLVHGTETASAREPRLVRTLARARAELARRLGRPIAGFRSPRLARSAALLAALDRTGFAWDSSYPDVDRESRDGFGAGVRLNLPFRPPVAGPGGLRASRCLELPVSAPDCIQPLYAGDGPGALSRAVRAKIDFVRATGGLYVGIVHAGVFGRRDGARRLAHEGVVARRLRAPEVWIATADAVARWWTARESLVLTLAEGLLTVENPGPAAVAGVRVVVEDGAGERVLALPPLAPGARAAVGIARAAPAAAGQAG